MPTLVILALLAAEPSFGDRGTVAPFGVVSLSHNDASGFPSLTELRLSPGALWFFTDGFAVGGSATVVRQWGDRPTYNQFGVNPRVAANVRLSGAVSWLPSAGVAWSRVEIGTPSALGSFTSERTSVTVFAPLLMHVSHFFVGFGPDLDLELSSNDTARLGASVSTSNRYALSSVIGGWF